VVHEGELYTVGRKKDKKFEDITILLAIALLWYLTALAYYVINPEIAARLLMPI
jgi:hypothetical protein